jgi:hypothetical protein
MEALASVAPFFKSSRAGSFVSQCDYAVHVLDLLQRVDQPAFSTDAGSACIARRAGM